LLGRSRLSTCHIPLLSARPDSLARSYKRLSEEVSGRRISNFSRIRRSPVADMNPAATLVTNDVRRFVVHSPGYSERLELFIRTTKTSGVTVLVSPARSVRESPSELSREETRREPRGELSALGFASGCAADAVHEWVVSQLTNSPFAGLSCG